MLSQLKSSQTFKLLLLLLLIIALPLIVFAAQKQQEIRQRASAFNCRNVSNNLLANCGFEEPIDLANGSGPNWRNTAIDGGRRAGARQYTNDLEIINTSDNGSVVKIGRESETCNQPKSANGGGGDPYRIFAEIRQTTTVLKSANSFHLSFDFKIKSRHTYPGSSPFYIWAGFIEHQSHGKEIFLAYSPHNEGGNFCNHQFRSDYTCEIGFRDGSSRKIDCSDAFNSWERITVDFNRDKLCNNPGACNNDQRLFVGFGVTNNYDTVVLLEKVVLTADGMSGLLPTDTQTPTRGGGGISPSITISPKISPSVTLSPTTRTPTRAPTKTPTPTPRKTYLPFFCPGSSGDKGGLQLGWLCFATPTPRP